MLCFQVDSIQFFLSNLFNLGTILFLTVHFLVHHSCKNSLAVILLLSSLGVWVTYSARNPLFLSRSLALFSCIICSILFTKLSNRLLFCGFTLSISNNWCSASIFISFNFITVSILKLDVAIEILFHIDKWCSLPDN